MLGQGFRVTSVKRLTRTKPHIYKDQGRWWVRWPGGVIPYYSRSQADAFAKCYEHTWGRLIGA